jgi:hypothetical protein
LLVSAPAFLLAAGFLIRLSIAWAPFTYLAQRGPLIDDAFYGFSIARNLARGAGATADGLHPTSGFQPLFTLLLIPLYWIFPGDSTFPIHAGLTLLALCGGATGWMIYRITRRIASRRGALFALLLWALSPTLLATGLNGLETGLLGLLVCLTVDYYLGSVREAPQPRRLVILGALLGLTVLSRVDAAILAAGVGFDLARLPLPLRRRLQSAGAAFGAGALVLMPYLLWLRFKFRTLLPQSGEATRFLSLCYGTRFVFGARAAQFFAPESPPLLYYLGSLRKALQTLVEQPLLFPASLVTAPLGLLGGLGPRHWVLVLGAGALWLLNLAILKRPRGIGEGSWKGFARICWISAALWIPSYALGGLGQWWFSRYFFPLFLLCTMLSGVALDRLGEGVALFRRLGHRGFAALACAPHLVLFAVQLPDALLLHKPNLNVGTYLEAAKILDGQVPPGSRTGAFQSGTLGYFSKSQVINLDGVVNADASRALRDKSMAAYVREEGIEAIIDWPWILEALLVRRSPEGAAQALGAAQQVGPFLLILIEPAGDHLALSRIPASPASDAGTLFLASPAPPWEKTSESAMPWGATSTGGGRSGNSEPAPSRRKGHG